MTLLYICLGASVATAAWLGYVNYRLSKSREHLLSKLKSSELLTLDDSRAFVYECGNAFEIAVSKGKRVIILRSYEFGDRDDKAYKWLHAHEVCNKFNGRP